jgi:putative ABC transport system permease protein
VIVDVLHLLRNLRRSRASAAAAVLTLSLTLGAAASIFGVVDAVLLTPPPFANPSALVTVGEVPLDDPMSVPRAVSLASFDAWRERAASLAAIEAFDPTNVTLTGMGAAERVSATDVTPGFLTLLGVAPALGRLFDRDDVGRPIVVISQAFWRGKLGGDPGVIGRQIVLGGQTHTVVGVLPARFFFALNPCDVWRPLSYPGDLAAAMGRRVRVVARLAASVSATSLSDALDDVSLASSPKAHAVATGVGMAIAGDATRMLGLLAGAATVAILVAFINLAGLLTVRSIERRRELAVRRALGARRIEVARQLLLETQALVALGIAGGVCLAWWMTPAAGRLVVERFGNIANRDVVMSWQVIAVVSAAAFVCACVAAALTTFVATRQSAAETLRQGASPPPRELMLRRILVMGEVALAFVLLVSMTLLGRSLLTMLDVNPGFDAQGVLTLRVSLPAASYDTGDRVASFYSALHQSLEGRLGPRTIAIVDEIPLTGDRGRTLVSARPTDIGREAVVRVAGTAYFDVMRIPIVAGRSFEPADDSAAPPRAVVSESVARTTFGSESPIGRRIRLASLAQEAEVIGIVGEVKHRALDDPISPTVYLSAWQAPSRSSHVVVRSTRPEADVIGIVREEVRRLDSSLPVYGRRSMQDVVDTSPGVPAGRVLTATFMGFAALAVVLCGIGLFGVVAHDVVRRRADLALRLALGADPMRILRGILGQGAVMVGSGLVAGAVLSFSAAPLLGTASIASSHLDIWSLGAATAVLIVAGLVAVLPAAWRAARTDPRMALRVE